MNRLFLAAVGVLYAALAAWCSVDPGGTSQSVGFEIQPGSGESEYLAVYGGLEAGLSLVFLVSACAKKLQYSGLLNCFLIHAGLVCFRTVGFFLYSGIAALTFQLAVGEWVLLIMSAILLRRYSGVAATLSD